MIELRLVNDELRKQNNRFRSQVTENGGRVSMSPLVYKTDQTSQDLILKAKIDVENKKKLAAAAIQQCKFNNNKNNGCPLPGL